jgi:hypothetical protein
VTGRRLLRRAAPALMAGVLLVLVVQGANRPADPYLKEGPATTVAHPRP